MTILGLIAMIILGILSAALSYRKKNYYLRVFDDILGREGDEKLQTRVGRGFIYGFFFPIYFVFLLGGLIALVLFLIVAGIVAAIVFVLVWISEKLLPHDWFGEIMFRLFESIGWKEAEKSGEAVKPVTPVTGGPTTEQEPPSAPSTASSDEGPKSEGTS